MSTEDSDSNEMEYKKAIDEILSYIPDADPEKIRQEFKRYENDFLIPPQDAKRSVMRKFQTEHGLKDNEKSDSSRQMPATKKVSRLTDLGADDRNVEIEVEIVTHNPRTQMVRGEERQIAFGLIEDDPWNEGGGERTRWSYKDWGNHPQLIPGSVVRIEGAKVNEYPKDSGNLSLDVNQTSRVTVLRESERPVINPNEPTSVSDAANSDGNVTIVARILSKREDSIQRKDGSGTMDIVKGRLADSSGALSFVSWEPFPHEVGSLIKIESAQVRRFRDNPELNIGRYTKVELYHDTNFESLDNLEESSRIQIKDLRDGAREVNLVGQLTEWNQRNFTNSEGEERTVWSGQLIDPTGRCRISAWSELPIDPNALPVVLELTKVRVRSWQGIPDVTIDEAEQIELIDGTLWEDLDLSSQVIEVSLDELASGTSRVGIETSATVVSVRDDCGIIQRCDECRRVLREEGCSLHGDVSGERDLRLRLVIDDGKNTGSVIVGRQASEDFLSEDIDSIDSKINSGGRRIFVQNIRDSTLGRILKVTGRSIVDEQGMMIIAESIEVSSSDPHLQAAEVRAKWGVA